MTAAIEMICTLIQALLESLSVRDSFDIVLYRKKIRQIYYILAVFLLAFWMLIMTRFITVWYLKTAAIILLIFVTGIVLYEGRLWKKLIVSLVTALVCLLFDLANLYIVSALLHLEAAQLIADSNCMCYMALMTKLIQMLTIKVVKCLVGKYKIKSMYRFDRVLCIVVPFAIVLNACTNLMKGRPNEIITNWDVIGIMFLVILGSIFYYMVYRLGDFYDRMSRSKIMESQMRTELTYMESLQESHKKIRQLAHGFENHLSVINFLMHNKEYDMAETYLSEISNTVEQNILPVHTNNIVIDAVLNQMFMRAVTKKITMNFNIQDMAILAVNVSDAASILNNGLNNAIEACEKIPEEKCRIIEVQIANDEKELMISIQNSTVEKEISIINNEIATSKQNKELHGLGLASIRSVLEKYNGKLFLECENYNFHLLAVITY